MNTNLLTSRNDANKLAAKIFAHSMRCRVSVNEDVAFKNGEFLPLGDIELHPSGASNEATLFAVRNGAFEWETPSLDSATLSLTQVLGADALSGAERQRADGKIRRIMDSIAAAPVRLGLVHPVFDPRSLVSMPFKRPITILSDTSGVIQGGLSFVARYLSPAARIKIPAVVQMEVVNFADRFLSNRRAQKPKPIDMLGDHLKSQAGQRVLLQLELHSDVELERTYLLGDPLRGAFQREEDKELKELNISVPIKAYADRLILEAARQHQSQVSYGHRVMLLTSDQGLARMALAEGVEPLYFHSVTAASFFGKRLTGTVFGPFTGELSNIGIGDVLWELATVFGCSRLESEDGSKRLTVRAIGKDLSWAPYHSHDDLLWVEKTAETDEPSPKNPSPERNPADPIVTLEEEEPRPIAVQSARENTRQRSRKAPDRPKPAKVGPALYKFSADRLIRLIDALDSEQRLAVEKVFDTLDVRTPSALEDYRRFLESGNAIVADPTYWEARPLLTRMSVALRNLDIAELTRSLGEFPSYAKLADDLQSYPVGATYQLITLGRAASTYQALAEITCLGAPVFDVAFFATPTIPTDEEFAKMALKHYEKLEQGDGWVATGRWLEELIQREGVHPLIARSKLQSASERQLIKRVTEGSTTETKFDRHAFKALDIRDGRPAIRTIHIFRGDFLIPGKSSSSLKIEGVAK